MHRLIKMVRGDKGKGNEIMKDDKGRERERELLKARIKELNDLEERIDNVKAVLFKLRDRRLKQKDSSEALINILAGRDLQWQFPKQTPEEELKQLDVPMQTEEEDPIPLDIVYPHSKIGSSSKGTNIRGQTHYGLRSLVPIHEEVVVVKKP
ncbi:hypothetical protein Tco_1130460 [Tanacetum coccineum]